MTAFATTLAAQASAATAPPAPASTRVITLDILRGFALLGILMLNIDFFGGPIAMHDIPIGTAKPAFTGWHADLDLAILQFKWLFFEGKMRTLFSLLFGASTLLLIDRLESRHRGDGKRIFFRRNLWLFAFGVIHGVMIWDGDILMFYSLIALVFLYPFRRLQARWLIVIGLVLGINGDVFGLMRFTNMQQVVATENLVRGAETAFAAHRTPTPEQQAAYDEAARERAKAPAAIAEKVRDGRKPYWQSVQPRAQNFFGFHLAAVQSGLFLEILGSMLLGMGLLKARFLTGERSNRTYLTVAILGYALAAPVVLIGIAQASASGFSPGITLQWMFLPYPFHTYPATLANASLLLWIYRRGWLRPLTEALRNVGRMALTNYIGTSLVCQTLFAWGPLKLYGALEYHQLLYVVVAVWLLNLSLSSLWLRHFRFGPLEWLWRSLTYWQVQPMRRQS